jgi:hypothetical protein
MSHSNKVREFVFGNRGVDLIDVCVNGNQVLTGTARVAQQARHVAMEAEENVARSIPQSRSVLGAAPRAARKAAR